MERLDCEATERRGRRDGEKRGSLQVQLRFPAGFVRSRKGSHVSEVHMLMH